MNMDEAPYWSIGWSKLPYVTLLGCSGGSVRQRGRDPRDQIEELEDANDKLSRAGDSQHFPTSFKIFEEFLKDFWNLLDTLGVT